MQLCGRLGIANVDFVLWLNGNFSLSPLRFDFLHKTGYVRYGNNSNYSNECINSINVYCMLVMTQALY